MINRKSTSDTCHFLGSSLICWSSQKQSSVVQSTTEVEYVAAASCCSQILWIVHTMRDFGVRSERVSLMCDNTSAISVAKNPIFHKRMRHLERRHHFLRDHIEKVDIKMRYIDTEGQLADIFIKPLDASRFTDLQGEMVFAILMAWFEGGLMFYLVYCIFFFSCIFFILTKVTLIHLLY
jgi:hypothetical protein